MEGLMKTRDQGMEISFHNLFNQLPGPIAVFIGKELRIAFVNDSYQKIFHAKELQGTRIREAFSSPTIDTFLKKLESVIDSGIPFQPDEYNLLSDFHNQYQDREDLYQFSYVPYRNAGGMTVGVIAYGQNISSREGSRKYAKQKDNRLENILEHSTDPILILKGKELILDLANEALFKLWDVGKENLGKPLLQILPEMKEQGFYDLLQNVYHKGITHFGHETSVYFVRDPGKKELRYFNFMYQPFRESDDRISGVLIMATEVTEQFLSNQKLLQSELNFKTMILQIPAAICVLRGPDHIVEICNEATFEIIGRKKEDLIGKPIHIGLPEWEEQGLLEILNQVYTTGERNISNERPVDLVRNGKKETAFINFVYEALREIDGSISGIICVGTEVTDQVRGRKESEYAEERARLAIGSADLGTYEINLITNEMFTSPRFNSIWGFDHLTINRNEYAGAIHPDDLEKRDQAHKESVKTGNLHYEARVIWKDKSIHWIKVKGRVLYDDDQTPVWLLGVIQDITEQKLFADELARKVTERTMSLQQSNERLERSNEELEQFAYITSHDLQEPLRKIQVFSNILLDRSKDELNPRSIEMLEKVSGSASRMSGLIRNLLDYSRIAQSEVLYEKTDLNLIVQNVLSDFELIVTQKKAVVNVDVLPLIEGVPLQMNQLFYNLIGNALKFSKKNIQPIIDIHYAVLTNEKKQRFPQLDPAKEYYEFIFRDNGIGFQQEYADKIFVIFQKLNAQSMFGGYGIGLAICRKIIENHHGIIYATGNINEGATFTIILPPQQD